MSATATREQTKGDASRPSLFRNRTFTTVWVGHTISILGDGFNSVALGLWVLQSTGSAKAMATIMSVRVLVGILLGVFAGTLVDRVDRRWLMIAMNTVRFGLVGALAYLIGTEGAPFWAVLTLTALTAVASQFFGPAFQASLVNIVGKEDLPRASGLLQVTNTLAQVAGPFLGGTIVALYGGPAAITGDALSFLVSALLLLTVTFPSPRREGAGRRSFWGDMREGISYIRHQPLVRALVVFAPVINFFGNAMGVVLPVIAVKVWLANSVKFGTLEALFPLGFAIGAGLIMAFLKRIRYRGWFMLSGIMVAGVLMTAVGLMPTIDLAMPLTLLAGIAIAAPNVVVQITMQSEVPTEVQGRVFGTMNSLVNVASPLSIMTAGILADIYGPVLVSAVAGGMMLLSAVLTTALAPALRNYR